MTDRQSMEVDIACVGFGPATGGFLTTLAAELGNIDNNGEPVLPSSVMPGMPAQVMCYERADDISFGVSGVVSLARALKKSFPDIAEAGIPLSCPVRNEKVAYLLDPVGASRRPFTLRAADKLLNSLSGLFGVKDQAFELPYTPPFLRKHEGMIFSIGQLNQWVGSQIMGSGMVQLWPGMPVESPLIEGDTVAGIRLVDQGTDKAGKPDANYTPGMDIKAALTVVGDGPVGSVGQQLNEHFGMPAGGHQREWAVGMKAVVELPEDSNLEPGTVLHTFGYPEPEIFGFMYVYPDRIASLGIFVPSSFRSPVRTSYRYLQHWMTHPYIYRHVKGGTLRSWGAKSLQESGLQGEPHLTGNGYARIGEGSGSTNMLSGSGVDEAWATGVQLAEGVIELIKAKKPFSKENLDEAYVTRRRKSWVHKEAVKAAKARSGFERGFLAGMIGMGLVGFSGGRLSIPAKSRKVHEGIPSLEEYFADRISKDELAAVRTECRKNDKSLHDALMDLSGWPKIEMDGKLLISHQDALLLGGKVQAAEGYADHVNFVSADLCKNCEERICVEICSGQAIMPGDDDGPQFDREKCVHCGACLWNCSKAHPDNPERSNIEFRAGSGGLHSAEN